MSAGPIDQAAGAQTTIGDQLEQVRLQRRALELERVLRRLRHRLRAVDAGAAERTRLSRAAAEFADELEHVHQRLRQAPTDA